MKALVKAQAGAGAVAPRRAGARDRRGRRADQGPPGPASAAPTSTSTTGTTGRRRTVPVPMIIGHEYAGEIVAVGADVRNLKVGQRVSGEGHVIGMRSRAARAGRFHLDPETRGIGVNIPGAFAEYVRIPAFNVVPLPDDDRRRDRRDPRSARQRRPHRALLRSRRRGRADHRRRADRHHGGGGRPPCRRAPRRHHRRQPGAARARGAGRRRRRRSTSPTRTSTR